jgi:hypothetical protein
MSRDEAIETCRRRCKRSAGAWARNTNNFAPSAVTTTAEKHYCEGWNAGLEASWPLFVEFVAKWMMRQPHIYGFQGRLSIVDRWRAAMIAGDASTPEDA